MVDECSVLAGIIDSICWAVTVCKGYVGSTTNYIKCKVKYANVFCKNTSNWTNLPCGRINSYIKIISKLYRNAQ